VSHRIGLFELFNCLKRAPISVASRGVLPLARASFATSSKTFVKNSTQLILALAAALPSSAALACASCGCTLNSDFGSQGLSTTSGWSLDVRYDTLNQNQLRAGTGSISAANAAHVTNAATGGPAEVEKFTDNKYLTTTLDYSDGNTWGVSVVVPHIDRSHSTLGVGGDGVNPGDGAYDSRGAGLGDVRVVARYYGFSESKNFGLQLGLKLPTGQTTQTATDGVTAVDPGLQRGTGTTDAIIGAYYFDNLSQNWDYHVQSQFQTALSRSTMAAGAYRPGNSVNFTAGLRYLGFESVTPTLQINARHVKTDSGVAADTFATGGTLVYLTPGVIVPVTATVALYSNLQMPMYQNLKGIQLAPTKIFSIGARIAF
jgi:hypothetical protein